MNKTAWVLRPTVLLFTVLICTRLAPAGNLPLPPGEARTPDTRTLTAEEAAGALQRDWLFQAMGEPLLDRATKEIAWARRLAARLARTGKPPSLSAELQELAGLEERLAEMREAPAKLRSDDGADPIPSWVWYPEGKPLEDAPASARFFRCRNPNSR